MKKKRRFVTLIEMMIVMFIISMIIGILGYNYRGFLEKGKAFKTKAGLEKLEDWLSLYVAENPSKLSDIENEWKDVVKESPIVKNPNDLLYDGWGEPYEVTVEDGEIVVKSQNAEKARKLLGGK